MHVQQCTTSYDMVLLSLSLMAGEAVSSCMWLPVSRPYVTHFCLGRISATTCNSRQICNLCILCWSMVCIVFYIHMQLVLRGSTVLARYFIFVTSGLFGR